MNNLYVTGIQHLGIPSNNMKETLEFYKKLGFQVMYQTINADERVAFLQLENLIVETYENGQATLQAGAVDHIALDSSNIEKSYQEVQKLGFAIVGDIEFLPFWENGVRFFKIQGPNGEIVEFCQRL
ncbi:lactoylglutathione lyase [Aequitasia blattaphilus]|uniref:VOC family protein n=1 Tax=Aequitasia blattaphilus TaxID=2949332 RepID=A0ABT1ECB1_9FIRM|nr:VOC family protein [Aequitasia blattaphilus]MCP1103489.1 VOC family protein [Aequitasia blattaphilus]MCR8616129.1 VOC family protein [Aequitasia blattaphilus]